MTSAETNPAAPSRKTAGELIFIWLHRLEDGFLILLLVAMIGLSGFQILLRNVFDSGVVSAEVAVRILVLWIGLFGAVVASRNDEHIRIDVLIRFLPDRYKTAAQALVAVVTAAVCGTAAFYSLRFVRMEYEDGIALASGFPAWICESAIPLAFAIIAIRYLARSFSLVSRFFRPPS